MDEDTIVAGERETIAGWQLEIDGDGRIISATDVSGQTFDLGQTVVANGRFAALMGTVGTLIEIQRPWTDGRTSDFLVVLFDGHKVPSHMKPKDLGA